MKIAFDAKRAFSNKSGLGNYSRNIIRALHEYYPQNSYYLFSPNPETDLLEEKYRTNTISPKTKNSILKSYWRSFKMGNDIAEINPDIYHGLSNELPKNITKTKAKKIVTIHDLIFLKLPHLYKCVDRKIYYKKFKFACDNADKIIATSIQTKNDIIEEFKINPEKIEVVYQSCNLDFSQKYSEKDFDRIRKKYNLPEKYILTVGTIEERKNALQVLKAIFYFNFDLDYVLVGRKTKYVNEIIAWAEEHKIKHKLHVLNNVSNEDLPIIYKLSQVFAYPSIYEGFGIPIIEAFSSEVPVITAEFGACSEIAGQAALKVDVFNPKSIGLAIKNILEDEKLKLELIEKAKLRVKDFSIENMIKNLYRVYQNL